MSNEKPLMTGLFPDRESAELEDAWKTHRAQNVYR